MQRTPLASAQHMGNLIIETGKEDDELNDSADSMKLSSDKAAQTIEALKEISEKVKEAISVISEQTTQTNESAQNIRRLPSLFPKSHPKPICSP